MEAYSIILFFVGLRRLPCHYLNANIYPYFIFTNYFEKIFSNMKSIIIFASG